MPLITREERTEEETYYNGWNHIMLSEGDENGFVHNYGSSAKKNMILIGKFV